MRDVTIKNRQSVTSLKMEGAYSRFEITDDFSDTVKMKKVVSAMCVGIEQRKDKVIDSIAA